MTDEVLQPIRPSQYSRRRLLVKGGLAAAGATALGSHTGSALGATPNPGTTLVPVHGLNHGIGGSDPLANGLVATNQGVNAATDLFSLSPRTASGLTFPVPTLRPEGGLNQNLSLDLMPKGAPGNFNSHGISWIDICDTDVLTVDGGDVATARVGVFTDHVEFGSRGFGLHSAKPLWIGVGMDGLIGTAQIRMSPGVIVIGAESSAPASGVVLGNGYALEAGATTGFTYLPSMSGTPLGAPRSFGAAVAIVVDTATSKLWARIGGTWKSVTLA